MALADFFDRNSWVNVVIKPKETFAAKKAGASIEKGLANYALAGVAEGFLTWFIIALTLGIEGGAADIALFLLGSVIISSVIYILAPFIISIVLLVFAKLFGGKGSFATQYYLISLYVLPIVVVSIIAGQIPFVGEVLSFLFVLYAVIWLTTMALNETHGYDNLRAALTWLAPFIIFLFLSLLLMPMVSANRLWLF
ncbi:MAG: YIP1 family protein [Candidatus Diapherotrites archaeon]